MRRQQFDSKLKKTKGTLPLTSFGRNEKLTRYVQ